MVRMVVYGDFNCPYSYLASQRIDRLAQLGLAEVEWRAVEHDPGLPLTGSAGTGSLQQELAGAARLALPGEEVPAAAPKLVSNTGAAVAAYAEAVTDGVQDELRRRLFTEIWQRQHNLSSAYEVRRVVRELTYPPDPAAAQLSAPDLPSLVHRHPNPGLLPRLSGCTIATDGGPLTSDGHRRVRQWRQEWLAGAGGVLPAMLLPDGMLPGAAALAHLADMIRPAGTAEPAAAS